VRRLLSAASMVKDISPAPYGSSSPPVADLNGVAYFTIDDGSHGRELWRSDGTRNSTTLVKDINPGPAQGIAYRNLPTFVSGGLLYFWANDGVHGKEPWVSDGTTEGTRLLRDVNPGPGSSDYAAAGGRPEPFARLGARVIFTAHDGAQDALWSTDGTPAGTTMYYANLPGAAWFKVANGVAFFAQPNVQSGASELWRTDGSVEGTNVLQVLTSAASGYWATELVVTSDRACFWDYSTTSLWGSDGTEAGTTLIKDLPGPMWTFRNLTAVGERMFFARADMTGTDLWTSDGTGDGTFMVKRVRPFPFISSSDIAAAGPDSLRDVNGMLYFAADGGQYGKEVWRSDGSEGGTYMVSDINAGNGSSNPSEFTALGDRVYFAAARIGYGRELWKTDGTGAGTVMVQDIYPGPYGALSEYGNDSLARVSGLLFFQATDGTHGSELWRTPGLTSVVSSSFNYRTSHSITMTFGDDVSTSVSASDLLVVNTNTGQPIDPAAMAVAFNAATKVATFTFPGLPGGLLPDGNYGATLPADSVTDPYGNPMGQDETLDFWYLAADPNRDGRLNLKDFNILAGNFGLAGCDFTQGDFNYDGQVDTEDFNILATRFGTALPGAAPAASVAGARAPAETRIIDELEDLIGRGATPDGVERVL
jgi:ELWxxDGT repeat protein